MGKGSGEQTSTQNTTYQPWTQELQKALSGIGVGMNANFLHAPAFNVAGFNIDQLKGMDAYRDVLGQYGPGGTKLPSAQEMMAGVKASPQYATAQQLGPNEFEPFMNPFLQNVLDPALANLNRQMRETSAGIGAKAAAAGSFGGSQEAIQKAQLDRSHGETVADLASGLMAQGYDRAQALAMANAQMRQQTEMANAQMGTQVNLANANNALASYGMLNNLQNSDFQRQLAIIQALLQSGQTQQNLAQTALNVPYYALDRMSQGPVWPMDAAQTATQPDNSPGMGQSLLGLGASLLGKSGALSGIGSALGGLFALSDEREKTDIQKVGKEGGLDMYAYRYKGDPKSYPKVVGPMAQDIEKKAPGAVSEIAGRKAVNPLFL